MNRLFLWIIALLVAVAACQSPVGNRSVEASLQHSDSGLHSLPPKQPTHRQNLFGYRAVVLGDFDGNGTPEYLLEHYCSAKNHSETNKQFDGITDYDQLVDSVIAQKPYCFLSSDRPNISSLKISDNVEQLGLAFLKNEGDLDGDGADEIGYVIDRADWTELNAYYIASYKNNCWQSLYVFPIWDWQLPTVPLALCSNRQFYYPHILPSPPTDASILEQDAAFRSFPGLVQKLANKIIQIRYRNNESEEDTLVVRLP